MFEQFVEFAMPSTPTILIYIINREFRDGPNIYNRLFDVTYIISIKYKIVVFAIWHIGQILNKLFNQLFNQCY